MTKLIYANTNNSDMYYAVKGVVPDAFYYIDTGTKKYVYLDSREYGVFKEENKNIEIELVLLDPIQNEVAKMKETGSFSQKLGLYLLRDRHQVTEVSVPSSFPLDLADYLRMQGIKVVPMSPFFVNRLHKTSEEVIHIRLNLRKTQEAFKKVEEILLASSVEKGNLLYRGQVLTSEFLKKEIEMVLLSQELFNTEGLIVSCGVHASIPHHRGKGTILSNSTIICDLFPRHRENGYFADMTRTYFKGDPTEYQKKMYKAVQEAQEKAIVSIRPGMNVKDVHQICVDHFLQNGFDVGTKGFVHGTGHGLGVDIHESPFINARSEEVLEEGMVVTVEPGLYYEQHGGVRIEDVVVVTKDGCDNLTNYPKQFILP